MQYLVDTDYNYAFNGMEKESGGLDGNLDFGARVYNSDVGSFLSRDYLESKHPDKSTYIAYGTNPILNIDPDGNDYTVFVNHINSTIEIKATLQDYDNSKSLNNSINGGNLMLQNQMITQNFHKYIIDSLH